MTLAIYQFNLQNKPGHATYLAKYFKQGVLIEIRNKPENEIIFLGGRGRHTARHDRGYPLRGGENLLCRFLPKHVSIYTKPDQIVIFVIEELRS